MRLGTPQIIILAMYMLGLGISLAKHGEEREGKYNFFISIVTTTIEIWVLNLGGFFK